MLGWSAVRMRRQVNNQGGGSGTAYKSRNEKADLGNMGIGMTWGESVTRRPRSVTLTPHLQPAPMQRQRRACDNMRRCCWATLQEKAVNYLTEWAGARLSQKRSGQQA